jgi:protein-S-isoprenylcysteine O-methyltransferase Ste14
MSALFQASRCESKALNVAKTLLQSAAIWALLLWLGPSLICHLEGELGIRSFHFQTQIAVGWILFGVASSLGLWSGLTLAVLGVGTPLPMDTASSLVIRGPFRWVRNPMAVAGLSQGAAVGVVLGSWGVLLYVIGGALFWHIAIRPLEEEDLHQRFGSAYALYQQRVPLWIPRFSEGHAGR